MSISGDEPDEALGSGIVGPAASLDVAIWWLRKTNMPMPIASAATPMAITRTVRRGNAAVRVWDMGVVPWRTRNQAVPLLDDPSGLVILASNCCSDVAVVRIARNCRWRICLREGMTAPMLFK